MTRLQFLKTVGWSLLTVPFLDRIFKTKKLDKLGPPKYSFKAYASKDIIDPVMAQAIVSTDQGEYSRELRASDFRADGAVEVGRLAKGETVTGFTIIPYSCQNTSLDIGVA